MGPLAVWRTLRHCGCSILRWRWMADSYAVYWRLGHQQGLVEVFAVCFHWSAVPPIIHKSYRCIYMSAALPPRVCQTLILRTSLFSNHAPRFRPAISKVLSYRLISTSIKWPSNVSCSVSMLAHRYNVHVALPQHAIQTATQWECVQVKGVTHAHLANGKYLSLRSTIYMYSRSLYHELWAVNNISITQQ